MNILVLGSGGREHALAWALAGSPQTSQLFVAPGNGGTCDVAENVSGLDICDGKAVAAFARAHDIGLVIVGPEAPLVAGVADALRAQGTPVFGPDAQGARLEGSKTFSKGFMERHGIPTARWGSFSDAASARAFVEELGGPAVVKADGLAAGKGVVVADNAEDANSAIESCFSGSFGSAGSTVVVEERLSGPECSLLAIVSNGRAVCLPLAQDHKRAYDGDLGPNTGGMGAYSPVPIVEPQEEAAMRQIMERAAAATAQEFDHDYRGVLYGGFMLTPQGPKMLEFNVRFGDPECEAVLPLLSSDLVPALLAAAEGRPEDIQLTWSDAWSVDVVLASGDYPHSSDAGKVILGIDDAREAEGDAGSVLVFHAGTALNADGELVTAGGRVLNVVGLGSTFEEARERAYRACALIRFEGKRFRSDIGEKASAGRDSWSDR